MTLRTFKNQLFPIDLILEPNELGNQLDSIYFFREQNQIFEEQNNDCYTGKKIMAFLFGFRTNGFILDLKQKENYQFNHILFY